ncbi:MAG: bifunctional [glutamine synthetase] adenylyltransferase/[glutamine synthetase]-adenylyl-L-tyrosine phosphorylase, partial [Actinomycetota bacterium]|nr:bifunctional [glutamine synthetase] adenylyltransferase/[glutamine synthetase]-adenylyl-L-tyrosine phosphorylase [Actinomycetota bacterium]
MDRTGSEPAGRATARLSRIGFTDQARAAELLTGSPLRLWDGARNEATDDASAAVLSALGRTADPDQALAQLAELAGTESGPRVLAELGRSMEFRNRLLGVLGASVALAEHLIAHPADALLLTEPYGEPAVLAAAGRIAAAVGADADDPVTGK